MVISPLTLLQGISTVGSLFFSGSKPSSGEASSGSDSTALSDVTAIAQKYDVKKISPRDMAALSSELYNAGQIPFSTHAMLSFQPEMGASTISGSAAADIPRNYLAQWQKEYEQARTDPSQQPGLEQKRISVQVLQNLDAMRTLQRT